MLPIREEKYFLKELEIHCIILNGITKNPLSRADNGTMEKRGEDMNELQTAGKEALSFTDGKLYFSFLDFLNVKENSIATYKTGVKRFLKYLVVNQITNPDRQNIIDFVDYLGAEELKPTTIHSYLISVKIFFDWMEQQGLYPNIAKRVKAPDIEKTFKHDYMTAEQCKRLLAKVDTATETGKRDFALLAVLLTTGIRTIEATRANTEDLTTRGACTVLYIQGKGKDEKADFVKIPEQTEDALRDYLGSRKTPVKKGTPLFTSTSNNNKGQRMTTRSIRRIAKNRLKEAGYISDKLTAHSFRHTAAVINLLNGGTLEETATLLRHASPETTRIYSHMIERDTNESERRIAAAIF